MSRNFNGDGTSRPSSPRNDYSKKGNRQEYSIFGWAGESASLHDAKSETHRNLQAIEQHTDSPSSKAAGVKTNTTEWKIPHRPVSARRLHDIQGHNIFDNGAQPNTRRVSGRKLHDMQGTYSFAPSQSSSPSPHSTAAPGSPRAKRMDEMHSTVFTAASDVLRARHVSPTKKQHLQGTLEKERRPLRKHVDPASKSAGDWAGKGKVVDSPKVTSRPNSGRVPPGGFSQITFG